jgi:hypothetical protein
VSWEQPCEPFQKLLEREDFAKKNGDEIMNVPTMTTLSR